MTKDVIMSVENEYTNSKDYFAIYICETPIKTSLASCSGYREDSFSMSFESSVNESLNNEFSYSASTSAEFFGTKITGSVRNSFGTSLSAGRVESIDITFIPSENTQQKIGAVLQGETYYCIVQSVYSYNSGNRIVSECCYSLFTFNDVVKHIQIMK